MLTCLVFKSSLISVHIRKLKLIREKMTCKINEKGQNFKTRDLKITTYFQVALKEFVFQQEVEKFQLVLKIITLS